MSRRNPFPSTARELLGLVRMERAEINKRIQDINLLEDEMSTINCPHCDGTGERYIIPRALTLSIQVGYGLERSPFLPVPCSFCKGKKVVKLSVAVNYSVPVNQRLLA